MIPKIVLYMIICTTCILCFFMGRIGYMWYEDNMDEENEYGSGNFVPVDYEIVQRHQIKKKEQGKNLFMTTSERLKNAFPKKEESKDVI